MKEKICNKIINKSHSKIRYRELKEEKTELRKYIPKSLMIEIHQGSGNLLDYPWRDYLTIGRLLNHAIVDITNREITIYDKKLYGFLRKYGEEHNYLDLVKCWRGCDNEN